MKVNKALSRFGYDESTLVAFSLCSDEVNRPLEESFYGLYGEHFNMGGLAGKKALRSSATSMMFLSIPCYLVDMRNHCRVSIFSIICWGFWYCCAVGQL